MRDVSTEQLCGAAGITDRTYRRARRALLASGELVLETSGVGGRGNRNVWRVPDPRLREGAAAARPTRRVPPPPGSRRLVATTGPAVTAGARIEPSDARVTNGGPDRAGSWENCPLGTGVSEAKGAQPRTVSLPNCPIGTGVSDAKGGQDRTLFDQAAAETPAQTPAPNARAGSEPRNLRTCPPSPPEGGSAPESIVVEQAYRTTAGRRRIRAVRIDLAEVRRGLGLLTAQDRAGWERIRSIVLEAVGDSTFALWIEPLELIAVDGNGALVVAAPAEVVSWLRDRFGRIIAACAEGAGHELRLADEFERRALGRNDGRAGAVFAVVPEINETEVS